MLLRRLCSAARRDALLVQRRGCASGKPTGPPGLLHARQRWVMANHAQLHRVALFVGHGGYILGLLEYGMTDIFWLRIFAIAGCVGVMGYQLLQPRVQWVTAGWMVIYVSVNVYQLYVLGGSAARPLSWEEERLYSYFSQHMTTKEFLNLSELGEWHWLVDGASVTEEGGDNGDCSLVMISAGVCDVSFHGRKVAELGPGGVVGEVALLAEGRRSSATVTAQGSVRCLAVPLCEVQALLEQIPEMRAPLERVFADRLAAKLVGMNRHAVKRNYRAVLEVACQLDEHEGIAGRLAEYRRRHDVPDEVHLRLVDELPQCVHRPFQLPPEVALEESQTAE